MHAVLYLFASRVLFLIYEQGSNKTVGKTNKPLSCNRGREKSLVSKSAALVLVGDG